MFVPNISNDRGAVGPEHGPVKWDLQRASEHDIYTSGQYRSRQFKTRNGHRLQRSHSGLAEEERTMNLAISVRHSQVSDNSIARAARVSEVMQLT